MLLLLLTPAGARAWFAGMGAAEPGSRLVLAGGLGPPIEEPEGRGLVRIQAAAEEPADADQPLDGEALAWARTAWAYFAGPPAPPEGQAPAPQPAATAGGCCCCGQPSGAGTAGGQPAPSPAAAPPGGGTGLVPARAGAAVATMWSLGDQLAALLLARRIEIIDNREFDRRLTRLLGFLQVMPLAFGEMPNRFYSTETGARLGADLQEGEAGWSAVDTGRLLIWLRIAAEEHPAFATYIRAVVRRFSVCNVLSETGRLQSAQPGEEGPTYGPETLRGYDAYAVQGYRAWGLEATLPDVGPSPFQIDIGGELLPLTEDVTNQAPVMTTPPAYLGLEFAFRPLGPEVEEEVAGGRGAEELMTLVHDLQALRWEEEGIAGARADFRRSEEPFTLFGTILANGYPWSVIEPGGAVRPSLALLTTRGAFGLDAFGESAFTDTLMVLVRELHDPALGWYEGRYEATGAYETTRTSLTNAFVLETLAHGAFGSLFPDAARPEALVVAEPGADGRCVLPLATLP